VPKVSDMLHTTPLTFTAKAVPTLLNNDV